MDEQLLLDKEEYLDVDVQHETTSYIKVLGVGGAGTNAVNHMSKKGINGVDLFVCNTDAKSLNSSPVKHQIRIGKLGAGNDPERGRKAAEENKDVIRGVFDENTRMVFITAGMGGGTGTGASPVIAKIAKDIVLPEDEESLLVVGVVTLPFGFEGRKRKKQAEEGIKKLKEIVDCIIIVNTDKLMECRSMPFSAAFALADDVLFTAVKGISEIITNTGYIQVDFRDIQSVMKDSGVALMGMGVAEGDNRALEAVKAATTSELLNDNDISKTKNILLTFSCSHEYEISMDEVGMVTEYLQDKTSEDVDVIWGISYDDNLGQSLSITLIATGFEFQDIYTPSTRGPIVIDLDENTKEDTAKPVQKTPETIVLKTDSTNQQKTEQVPTSKKEPERRVIRVDEDMKPIKGESVTKEPSASAPSSPQITFADAPRQELKRQVCIDPKNAKTLVDILPEREDKKPYSTQITEPEQPKTHEKPQSELITIVNKETNGLHHGAAYQHGANETFEIKMERMRKIREAMQTEEGIETIMKTHPTAENNFEFTRLYSASTPSSTISVNKAGDVEIKTNTALNAGTD
ncbi:MAG: cell division protein FtsZ [Candidatus Onthomorpha sp.]